MRIPFSTIVAAGSRAPTLTLRGMVDSPGALRPDLRIDEAVRCAELEGRCLRLTRIEFDLLLALRNANQGVVRRDDLVWRVWHRTPFDDGHTLEVHISRLRRKLAGAGADPGLVGTVRGVGYRLAGAHPRPRGGPVGTVVAGADGRIALVSDSVVDLGGPRPVDLIGTPLAALLAGLPDRCSAIVRPLLGYCGHVSGVIAEIARGAPGPFAEPPVVVAGLGGRLAGSPRSA